MPASRQRSPKADPAESLAAYSKKRDFAATPEPSGTPAPPSSRLRFVVQKHDATRLHYDFRLEAAGVLASWAVPKGPTLVPGNRRLAMHVEDHPMAYRDFEGVIPKGQYGAGEVIVWDRGWYALAEGDDPAEEIARGKIKFTMHGKKLKGLFTLIRMKAREGEAGDPWLLIKDRDGNDPKQWEPEDFPASVKSGRTLEDIRSERSPKTWQSRPAAARVKQGRRSTRADAVPRITTPMLATLVDEPFDDDAWVFELKWDGYRAVATVDAHRRLSLISRNGLDLLERFPDMAALARAFTTLPIVVDGEIVSLDAHGRSDFQRLQEQAHTRNQLTYVAFDLLYADGRDLRRLPLEERKALLARVIRDDGLVLYSKHIPRDGKALFEQAKQRQLEGIIGKRRRSTYQERRSRDWVKIKAQNEQEFVIGGWTQPRGSRKGFGALLLGVYEGDELRYVGHVGTGFSAKGIDAIMARLTPLEVKRSPFSSEIASNTPAHWVKPELVAQVRFAQWTREGHLRQPAFLGLRIDESANDVRRDRAESA
jgi:bifunctional non-homologous end joining protein LigD